MPKKSFREQVNQVAEFVGNKVSNWVTTEEVAYEMNCGATQAVLLMKTVAKVSSDFKYSNGDIIYSGLEGKWDRLLNKDVK